MSKGDNRPKGKLIVLEGLDGAGSTTQAERLVPWLVKEGKKPIHTREPTDAGPAGGLIRLALTGRIKFDNKTLAALYLADRMDHLFQKRKGIARLVEEPTTVVVSDRYYLSSFAYQVLDKDIDFSWLKKIHSKCIQPDLTIFIDVPPEECLRRITLNRGFHFELFEKQAELEKARKNYLAAIERLIKDGENIQIVDGQGTSDQVEARIRVRVKAIIENGTFSPDEKRALFTDNIMLSELAKALRDANLQLLLFRRMEHGYQLKVADSGDLVSTVNLFNTRSIRVQGKESPLKEKVRKIADRIEDKYGNKKQKSRSKTAEVHSKKQYDFFKDL